MNDFGSKRTLTKINDPEGGNVYIYFLPNENDFKDMYYISDINRISVLRLSVFSKANFKIRISVDLKLG